MAELVRGGLFVSGFPPDSGDHIGLEIDGELSEFCVYRVHDGFHCEEIREANPRRLRHSEEELTMHMLVRTSFYELVAKDLGITGQVIELGHGIWELGRKRLPGRDASKVIYIEDGVPASALELILMRDPFMTLCLLHRGKSPMHDWHSDKTLFRGVIEVRDGRYASDVFEDLSESQQESSSAARIELEELPPKLWICGEEFKLPISPEGIPTDGCRYLAYLFDHGDKPITCWDLYLAIRPEEKEKIGGPGWSDEVLDESARLEFRARLKEARAELREAELDPSMPAEELEESRDKVHELEEQAAKLFGKGGRSRQIVEGDRGKARQRVRKALKLVIEKVKSQDDTTGAALAEALGEGDLVTFRPPPDWRL
jgi:hypothetical protein